MEEFSLALSATNLSRRVADSSFRYATTTTTTMRNLHYTRKVKSLKHRCSHAVAALISIVCAAAAAYQVALFGGFYTICMCVCVWTTMARATRAFALFTHLRTLAT